MNPMFADDNTMLDDVSKFNVKELSNRDLSIFNGGALSGAVAAAVGGGLAAVGAGMLIGVGIYYGVKWLTS